MRTIPSLDCAGGAGDSVEHETLEKIARGYGVSIRYLVTGQDLAVEFWEHMRSLTAAQWQALIASTDDRLREVLRFLERRGEGEGSLAAIAGKAAVPEEIVARFVQGGVLNPEQWENLAMVVSQLLKRALPAGWLRAGVRETDDMVGMVASALSRAGRGFQTKQNAGRR